MASPTNEMSTTCVPRFAQYSGFESYAGTLPKQLFASWIAIERFFSLRKGLPKSERTLVNYLNEIQVEPLPYDPRFREAKACDYRLRCIPESKVRSWGMALSKRHSIRTPLITRCSLHRALRCHGIETIPEQDIGRAQHDNDEWR